MPYCLHLLRRRHLLRNTMNNASTERNSTKRNLDHLPVRQHGLPCLLRPAIMLLGSKRREDKTTIAEIAVGVGGDGLIIGTTPDVFRTRLVNDMDLEPSSLSISFALHNLQDLSPTVNPLPCSRVMARHHKHTRPREAHLGVEVGVGDILVLETGAPDHLRNTQETTQLPLDIVAGHARVAVLVNQVAFGDEERALAVDDETAALGADARHDAPHRGRRVVGGDDIPREVGILQQPVLVHRGVAKSVMATYTIPPILVSPFIELEADGQTLACGIVDVDGARVPNPAVVDCEGDDMHLGRNPYLAVDKGLGVCNILRASIQTDRLELRYCRSEVNDFLAVLLPHGFQTGGSGREAQNGCDMAVPFRGEDKFACFERAIVARRRMVVLGGLRGRRRRPISAHIVTHFAGKVSIQQQQVQVNWGKRGHAGKSQKSACWLSPNIWLSGMRESPSLRPLLPLQSCICICIWGAELECA